MNLELYGRRLDSRHSQSKAAILTIFHLRDFDKPVDYDDQARRLMSWLTDNLPPGTLTVMEWNRDAVRKVQRLRTLNESLAARLAAASEVLGRCAEKGKVDGNEIREIVGSCVRAVGNKIV